MKAYLWSTNNGNASWTVYGGQGTRQGTKPASGKFANFFPSYSSYYYSRKSFIPRQLIHGCRYCSLNNANKLRLLVSTCFWVKKKKEYLRVDKSFRKNTVYGLKIVCSYLCHNHYMTRMTEQRHSKLPCSNHVYMGITYMYVNTRISYLVEINLV